MHTIKSRNSREVVTPLCLTTYMAEGSLRSTSKTHGTFLKRSYRCVSPAEGFVVAVIFNQLELV